MRLESVRRGEGKKGRDAAFFGERVLSRKKGFEDAHCMAPHRRRKGKKFATRGEISPPRGEKKGGDGPSTKKIANNGRGEERTNNFR